MTHSLGYTYANRTRCKVSRIMALYKFTYLLTYLLCVVY